jgi:uncharacterized protein
MTDALAGNVEYEVPAWNQIYDMLLTQAQKILSQHYLPDIAVGISRGGLVPARILTDLLETKELTTLQIQFYTDIEQTLPEPTLKRPLTINLARKQVLLVDDIVDSGESLQLAKTHVQTQGAAIVKTVTLYLKPKSKVLPDFFGKQTSNWVVFPWDIKETLRKIVQRQEGKHLLDLEVAKLVKAGLPKTLVDRLLKDMT